MHVWLCDCALVSTQAEWTGCWLTQRRPGKPAIWCYFEDIGKNFVALPNAFPTYLLLVLLRNQTTKRELSFYKYRYGLKYKSFGKKLTFDLKVH